MTRTSYLNFLDSIEHIRARNATEYMLNNHIVIVETDTILGLSCSLSPISIESMIKLKNRSFNKQFVLIASNLEQLLQYIDQTLISVQDLQMLLKVYSKPTSFIVPARSSYLNFYNKDNPTLAIRIVRTGVVRHICEMLNSPIISTSANLSGQAPILSAYHASQVFSSVKLIHPYPDSHSYSQPSRIIDLLTKKIIRD